MYRAISTSVVQRYKISVRNAHPLTLVNTTFILHFSSFFPVAIQGMLDITELQNKMQKDIDELKVEELSRSQRSRYDKVILEMTKATAVTAGGMMNALF